MPNFTVKLLNNLPNAEPGKRPVYHDAQVKGLSLRVTQKVLNLSLLEKGLTVS